MRPWAPGAGGTGGDAAGEGRRVWQRTLDVLARILAEPGLGGDGPIDTDLALESDPPEDEGAPGGARLARLAERHAVAGAGRVTEELLELGMRVVEQEVGKRHLSLVGLLHALGCVRYHRGDLDGAERDIDRAVEIASDLLAAGDPVLLHLVETQARLRIRTGRFIAADAARRLAIRLRLGAELGRTAP